MARRSPTGADGWTLRRMPARVAKQRRGIAASTSVPPAFLQADGVTVDETFEATPAEVVRRGAGPPDLALDVALKPGESALLALRHPSGAITFHPSAERAVRFGRRGAAGASVASFRLPVRRVTSETSRRGVLAKAVKVIVIKVAKAAADKAVGVAMSKLAAAWERRVWRRSACRRDGSA